MGKPFKKRILGSGPSDQTAPTSYRDDPDAVSLHTTPDSYEYPDAPPAEPNDELPSYSASTSTPVITPGVTLLNPSTQPSHPRRPETSLSAAERAATVSHVNERTSDFAVRRPGGWRTYRHGKAVNQNATTVRLEDRLADPTELHDYIVNYLALVKPHPTVRIHGHHQEHRRDKDGKSRTEQVTDFDVTLDMQQFLRSPADARFWGAKVVDNADKVHRGSWRKTAAKGHTQAIQVGGRDGDEEEGAIRTPSLREWCDEYCASPAWLKIFRVNRRVLGLNEAKLRGLIDRVIRETDYLGHIDVTFPVEETHVDIYSPHAINRWRIGWVRWLFYVSFLWVLTWPVLFFATRRWDVYNVNWLFSYVDWEDGTVDEDAQRITYPRHYATISEEDWFERHRAVIRRMVLMKHQGDATGCALHIDNEPVRPAGMLPSTGNGTLDSAAGIIQAGFSAWNAVRGGRVPTQGWGADC